MQVYNPTQHIDISQLDWDRTPESVLFFIQQLQGVIQHQKSLLTNRTSWTQDWTIWQKNESRYQQFIEIQQDFILRSLPDTTITYVNQPLALAINQPTESLIGQKWVHYANSQNLPEVLQHLSALTPENPSFIIENEQSWGDGLTRWTQWMNQGIFSELGSLIEIQCIGRDITNLKQTELALRESERRFQSLTANLPAAIYQYEQQADGSEHFTYVSPGIKGLFGFGPQDIEADASLMWRAIYPDDLTLVQISVSESARTLHPWFAEFRILTLTGELKWIRGTSKPERMSNGTVVWDGFLIDVSSTIKVELDLQESQERYASLAKAVPVGIFRTDAHGKYVYANDRWSEIVGLDIADAIGESWLKAIHLHDREFVSTEWYRCTEQNIPFKLEFRFQQPDGEVIWVYGQVVAEYNSEEEVKGYVGTITDITDRKLAEQAIQNSEERYRLLAENSNDLVCLLNRYGRFIYVSPSSKSLLGYPHQDLIGASFFDFLHAEDKERFRQELSQIQAAENSRPFTARMKLKPQDPEKSEEYIWFETLTKPIFDTFGQVFRLQTTSRNITDRVQAQEILRHDALHDNLTGLPNRNLLVERLELAIQRAKRKQDYHFAVLFLDLDRFKVINDSLGHLAGDQLLIYMADKLQSLLRSTDVAARLGGDEFVILLEDVNNMQQVIHVAERIFAELRSPVKLLGREVFISTSIGIVWSNPTYTQPSELLRNADIAMYRAKSQGRGRYQIFDLKMHAEAIQRLDLEHDLRQAFEREEFVVYYQPIIALETASLVGFEALVRWQHPHQGLVYPGGFIQVAEETGLIVDLDRWVLKVACQQLVAWQATFSEANSLKMSVNLSAQDLWNENLIQDTANVLKQTGLMGNQLILEITESMLISDIDMAVSLLTQLKNSGIQISIDDFGTGYASLSYLHRLPVDSLKIDRSFVNRIQENQRNYKIIETIITLSRQLDIHTVAEGIETDQELNSLQQIGCNFAQGYLFSKPLSAADATKLLAHSQ